MTQIVTAVLLLLTNVLMQTHSRYTYHISTGYSRVLSAFLTSLRPQIDIPLVYSDEWPVKIQTSLPSCSASPPFNAL